MKPIHLRTQYHPPTFIPLLCGKNGFVVILVVVIISITQDITATVALPGRKIHYPGNETDHIALLGIKSQLRHSDSVLSSWNNSVHHCNWEGVTCGRKHKRVTVLDLRSRGLEGTISPFIGNMTFLKVIWLYNNSLYGKIPDELGNIFRLRDLRINNNTLVGQIPANVSRCINLRYVYLGYNKLDGKLPAGLKALSKLQNFSVGHNYLTGNLFDTIQNLTSLVKLFAPYNSFTGTIPNTVGRMRNLSTLELSENKLSGTLPASFFNLSSLQAVSFSDNQFHGKLPMHIALPNSRWTYLNLEGNSFSGSIPIDILNLTTLEVIALDDNSFTGRVPRDFRYFQSLNILALAENYLVGDIDFISTLVNCSQLRILDLGPNNFSGILPKSVANLSTSVEWFVIVNTPISGTFPAGITNLKNLERLAIFNCKITASLPQDFGRLYKLELLALMSNRLTGTIPSSLGNLSRLTDLHLDNNLLEGSLPPRLGNCQSLLNLYVSNNKLNGTLGNELFEGSATLVELDLSYNLLEGPLPDISKQTSLEIFRVSQNNFSGLIPEGLGDCSDLQYLYMDGNSFDGNIPTSFASLGSLQEMNVSRNNLSGPIPGFFSKLTNLYSLDLSHNNFEGRVPTNSVFGNASAVFVDGNTRLCGGIQQLHLPKCSENESKGRKNRRMSHALRLIVAIISPLVVVLLVAAGLYLVCIKKKSTPLSSGSMMGDVLMKVSYDMLLKATAGFSSENLLGRGSFGSVFKGILDGKTVAVKVLNLQHYGASKSFMAECKALRNVRHRNLVDIITACASIDFQRNEFKALVYEFMLNGSLDRWLHGADGKMSLAQRVDVAIDVAHALYYLHHECETPIVHCDLKPSNILLDNDMVAHVGDFGLSKFLIQPQHPNQSSTIGIRGTVGYAAPEYGLGSEASTDGDVYSYGILLLELMTGKSPTNSMFKEHYNLHMYAEEALPDRVLQIVDPSLEEDDLTEEEDDRRAIQDLLHRRGECIISVISVGVSCSNHLPQNRMRLNDATTRLQSSRDNLLGARRRRNLPARGASD